MKHLRAFVIAAALLTATSASSRTFVVDQSGAGDFTAIQAALDQTRGELFSDTIVVHAGHYAEHILFPVTYLSSVLCPSGPESTTVLGASFEAFNPPLFSDGWCWEIFGLGVIERHQNGQSQARGRWDHCSFRGGYEEVHQAFANLRDCDFSGPVVLLNLHGELPRLRFHDAALLVAPSIGDLRFRNCEFTGGLGDTLVFAPRTEDLSFHGCTFDSADVGIWAPRGAGGPLFVNGCQFGYFGTAIGKPAGVGSPGGDGTLVVAHSRFDRCTQAVKWPGGRIQLSADTLADCGDRAIAISDESGTIDQLLFERISGTAIEFIADGSLTVTNSVFQDVDGVGLRVSRGDLALSNSRFERCSIGAELTCQGASVTHNVFFSNRTDGIRVNPTAGDVPSPGTYLVAYNTAVANEGVGINLMLAAADLSSAILVDRNIAANNGDAGIRVNEGLPATLSSNDSWHNQGLPYSGATPDASNLELDPRFCAPLTGDLTLNLASPCAPNAITGPIGALGVGCSDTLATPALLSLVSAEALADRVELTWFGNGSPGEAATVYRATTDAEWLRVADIAADGAGYLRYSDVAVVPGTRYGYRLGIGPGGSAPFVGSTWVVAASPALALEGVRPNPTRSGPLTAQFVLSTAGPAQLELLDVTGRRITSHEVGTLGAGRHSLDLARGMALPPGVYLVRLTTAGRAITARAVVLK